MSDLRTDRDVEFFFVAGMATAGTRPHVAREEFARWLAAHVAEVTEAAVRERIANAIKSESRYGVCYDAENIARGGTR